MRLQQNGAHAVATHNSACKATQYTHVLLKAKAATNPTHLAHRHCAADEANEQSNHGAPYRLCRHKNHDQAHAAHPSIVKYVRSVLGCQ